MKPAPWKEGEGEGPGPAYAAPFHLLTPAGAASIYDGNNLVKFLKLPASLSSRPGGHVVFYRYEHLVAIFVPCRSLEDMIHTEALSKFT